MLKYLYSPVIFEICFLESNPHLIIFLTLNRVIVGKSNVLFILPIKYEQIKFN